MTDKFYKPLPILTKKTADVIEEFMPRAQWHWVPYVTLCENIEQIKDDFYSSNPLLNAMKKELDPTLALYQFPASSFYEWHTDSYVGASLNMLLKPYESLTLFSEETEQEEIFKVTQLKYVPKQWYIFNNQSQHCVVNHGSEDRVLLTVTLPREYTYEGLVEWCEWHLSRRSA